MRLLASFDRNRRWLGALLLLAPVVLSACATGAPTLSTADPTPTELVITVSTPTEIPSPTATPDATAPAEVPLELSPETPAPPASPTPPPPSPTAEPTTPSRPEPPPDPGTGLSQVIYGAETGRPEVALTFDAGADRGFTEEILDTLAAYDVRVSFGVTGQWSQDNPDLVRRIVEEGHMVFNHSWSHRSMTGASTADWDEGVLTTEERWEEVTSTADVIREETGYEVAPYFRPPYGDINDSMLSDIYQAGYWVTVMWTCDSLGWNGLSADEIVARCGDTATAGDIILLHVGADSQDSAALPGLIESIQGLELSLVTVEELLAQ